MRSDQMPTKANLKDHDHEACQSVENELIASLNQQNDSLLAQVEELRSVIVVFMNGKPNLSSESSLLWHNRVITNIHQALAKTPEQSLDSLKASIEEETIERITQFFKDTANATPLGHESRRHGASTYNWSMQSYNDVKHIPRKYQPTNEGDS